ncbi:MAG: 5'/3'-nucleotidase SurE, partial [Candidatus Hodarchaeota archaeon]
VNIVAPSTQQTATSKSMTFDRPIRVYAKRIVDGIEGLVVDGTPADAFTIGIHHYPDIDFVVSGINAGDNTSIHSLLTSGTVAVCLEAAVSNKINGWAFSLDTASKYFFTPTTEHNLDDFKVAAKRAVSLINKILISGGFPDDVSFFSVNFPNNLTETTPIRIARPMLTKYTNFPIERKDPRDTSYFWIWGDYVEPPLETDTYWVRTKKEIAITPYSIQSLQKIDEMAISRFKKLFNGQ